MPNGAVRSEVVLREDSKRKYVARVQWQGKDAVPTDVFEAGQRRRTSYGFDRFQFLGEIQSYSLL